MESMLECQGITGIKLCFLRPYRATDDFIKKSDLLSFRPVDWFYVR